MLLNVGHQIVHVKIDGIARLKSEGKSVPLQSWSGPEGSRK